MVAVVSAQNREDIHALDTLKLTLPECRSVLVNAGEHNVSGYFYRVGTLRLFYACLLDYWRDLETRSDLLVVLEQVTALGHRLKTKQEDQIGGLRQAAAHAKEKNREMAEEYERKVTLLQRKVARLERFKQRMPNSTFERWIRRSRCIVANPLRKLGAYLRGNVR
jgi:hypothetical protein